MITAKLVGMKVASFFAGAGGLDLGFEQAGYEVSWANEYNPRIRATYEANHPGTVFDGRPIEEIKPEDVPSVDGIIGAPPCQSWSVAGHRRGIEDPRGRLFYPYIAIVREKKPLFFVAENVPGIVTKRHRADFESFLEEFRGAGYEVSWQILRGTDFGVAQMRRRVIVVGVRSDLPWEYRFPEPVEVSPRKLTLRGAIGDIKTAFPTSNRPVRSLPLENLEYQSPVQWSEVWSEGLRRDEWDKPSYTIGTVMASLPIHPDSPRVQKRSDPQFGKVRRLSVRECARVQGFPDSFRFVYDRIRDGFLMVGNATPPPLAYHVALSLLPLAKFAEDR